MSFWHTLILVVVICSPSISAYVQHGTQSELNTRSSGLDPILFQKFQRYAHYAEASYNPENMKFSNDPRPVKGIPVESKIVWSVSRTPISDTQAFVAVDNNEIVLAIRGSVSTANWIADVKFSQADVKFCTGCKVHTGFATAWQEIKFAVNPVLWHLAEVHPNHKIVVVGHSLGGAVATLAGFDLKGDARVGSKVEMFAYASPRVGDGRLASWMTNEVSRGFRAYRITAARDPVPRLPLEAMGYAHFRPEYYLSKNSANPKLEDVLVDSQAKTRLSFSIVAHGDYFMKGIDHLGGNRVLRLLKGQVPTMKNMFKTMDLAKRAVAGKIELLLARGASNAYWERV